MKEPEVITGLHSMGVSYKRILELFIFNEENPEAWPRIQRIALEMRDRGEKYISVKHIWEIIRKNNKAQKKEDFALNNNLTSTIARLLILKYKDLEPYIELRSLKEAA